jgi:hypothetical protein
MNSIYIRSHEILVNDLETDNSPLYVHMSLAAKNALSQCLIISLPAPKATYASNCFKPACFASGGNKYLITLCLFVLAGAHTNPPACFCPASHVYIFSPLFQVSTHMLCIISSAKIDVERVLLHSVSGIVCWP